MLVAIAIDDEPLALQDFLKEVASIETFQVIRTYTNAKEAIDFLIDYGKVDIIFCDIKMPDLSGIKTLELCRSLCDYFIFLTAYPEHMNEAFEKMCDAYLHKPAMEGDIRKHINRFIEIRASGSTRRKLLPRKIWAHTLQAINGKYAQVPIVMEDVSLITGVQNYVHFTLAHKVNEIYTVKSSLISMLRTYPDLFVQVNRAQLVAKGLICQVHDQTVYLENGQTASLSSAYSSVFRSQVLKS
jgi:two-component system, LytTR family, response regulator